MRLKNPRGVQLTYCTNIHPSNGLNEVLDNLERYALLLKERLAPDTPFGIGLRLSGPESRELLEGDNLARFKAFLDANGLYVFTFNGFPYGPFHRQRVKEQVHAPDWQDEERVQYTLRLVRILDALLPEGMGGGISTSPLSYKAWVDTGDGATWRHLTENLVRIAQECIHLERAGGKRIHLDLEPEPDGLLENSRELVAFFQNWLLMTGAEMLSERLAIPYREAQDELLEHIRVCFDTCHVAVAFEDPAEVLDRFSEVGIKVGKVQVSSALKVDVQAASETLEPVLASLAESTYLHQVVQGNTDGSFVQYADLPDALPHLADAHAREWRIHFHVPIFVERYGLLTSTQDTILQTFALLRERGFTEHLEIETYTWEVLPPELKQDLLESIHREYAWVLDVL
jgi:sugar phosphate isomerase/epimerase